MSELSQDEIAELRRLPEDEFARITNHPEDAVETGIEDDNEVIEELP